VLIGSVTRPLRDRRKAVFLSHSHRPGPTCRARPGAVARAIRFGNEGPVRGWQKAGPAKLHGCSSAELYWYQQGQHYSFGILQSEIHWVWFINRCSTLKSDYRYTSNTVFDSFPWPQQPTLKSVKDVAEATVMLRTKRNELRMKHGFSLRELYRSPGDHPLKDVHNNLDEAVRAAYGMSDTADPLAVLLELNTQVAAAEENGDPVQGPGLPGVINDPSPYITTDCIKP
jgi:hypothetical protein